MRRKWLSLTFISFIIILLIALCGALLNTRFPSVKSGESLAGADLSSGIALSSWEEVSPQQWQFRLTDLPNDLPLVICFANPSVVSTQDLLPLENTTEFFRLRPNEPELLLNADSNPSCWLMTESTAWWWINLRKQLQLVGLVFFLSIGAAILTLFRFKPQAELGYFLLYIAVMFFWGLTVAISPSNESFFLDFLSRLYFPLAILVPLWLCVALTHLSPFHQRRLQFLMVLGSVVLFLLPTLYTQKAFRNAALGLEMLLVVLFLSYACTVQKDAAHYLLAGYLPTTGLRFLILTLPLQPAGIPESFALYMIRCARIYDIPFALGCLVYVCRRFALQFDRAEQLTVELEQRVAQRTQALQDASDARKSMMLNIFHDLRSPLFVVRNGLETMEASPESAEVLLPVLQQRIGFVQNLTEDLFLAAKLEQKQILLNEDRVLLDGVTQTICDACKAEVLKKEILLRVDVSASLPVWGDVLRLEQIIQNLLTNAIHYTPVGGSITVKAFAEEHSALVQVSDTGCGIAPEDQNAVFDRYFHTTTNSKHDSTGLGLTIAQELAHLHHGEITLTSEVGTGSTFTLRLPLLENN